VTEHNLDPSRPDLSRQETVPIMTRIAALLSPLLLLAACGNPQQHSAQVLNNRMLDHLSAEIAAGKAVVQPLPSGTQITLLDPSQFPNDDRTMEDQFVDMRADVIEGLLDPSLMRVQVADTSTLPQYQRQTRIANVAGYFTANGLGPVLVPAAPAPATPGPAGLLITVNVQCPPPDGLIGYGDGRSHPVCD
jgi:hypothetical protein